jgi:chromosome partitioning protein
MTRIVSILNPKGGVGKTTTAVNLGCSLGLAGRRTLVVDLGARANAETVLGLRGLTGGPSADAPAEVGAARTPFEHLEVATAARTDGGDALRRALGAARGRYDVVLVDCPPGVDPLVASALAASDAALVPIQCAALAAESAGRALALARATNARLELDGILITMAGEGTAAAEIEAGLRARFAEHVYSTVIPRDEALAEAASHGRPVFHHRCSARGTRAYLALAKEVMEP